MIYTNEEYQVVRDAIISNFKQQQLNVGDECYLTDDFELFVTKDNLETKVKASQIVNDVMSSLLEDGYLGIEDDNYILTADGFNLLNN